MLTYTQVYGLNAASCFINAAALSIMSVATILLLHTRMTYGSDYDDAEDYGYDEEVVFFYKHSE